MQLLDCDVHTREVREWQGLHVFHAGFSTCSQKLRMYLQAKGLEWISHPIDLAAKENLSDYFLGVNPRGLVPVLVDDGVVHIESNDIIRHLEQRFPSPQLIPAGRDEALWEALRFEDELHLAIRTLSLLFLFAPASPPKSADDLARYTTGGSGTIGGKRDPVIGREIAFWTAFGNGAIADDAARAAAAQFREALDRLDERLGTARHLLGDSFSILDIAWIVYVNRLRQAGYPLEKLHPQVGSWFARESERPGIAEELAHVARIATHFAPRQLMLREQGRTLASVCFPELA